MIFELSVMKQTRIGGWEKDKAECNHNGHHIKGVSVGLSDPNSNGKNLRAFFFPFIFTNFLNNYFYFMHKSH